MARRDGEDAAADPALPGQADAEGELATIVVMAAQHHHAVDPPRPVPGADLLAGLRVAAVEGEEAAGPGELAAAHRDRALPEIGADRDLDRIMEVAEILHEPGEAAVAGAGVALRGGHLLVHRDRGIAGLGAEQ